MTCFPLAVYRHSKMTFPHRKKAALDHRTNLIKSREYNVQNVTVRCYYVSDDGV